MTARQVHGRCRRCEKESPHGVPIVYRWRAGSLRLSAALCPEHGTALAQTSVGQIPTAYVIDCTVGRQIYPTIGRWELRRSNTDAHVLNYGSMR